MPSLLTLHIDGPFEARAAQDLGLAGLSARGKALLAYLALAPGGMASRAALAGLLWGDRAEEQARASLRQELTTLRKHLPDGLLAANREAVTLDMVRVRIAPGAGPLLDGLVIRASGFEDWLRDARIRRAAELSADALKRARTALSRGDADAAMEAAERALAHDPDNEPALQVQLRAACAGGSPARGLALHQRFADRQRAEYASAPSSETEALAEALRAGPAAAPRGAVPDPRREPAIAVLPFDDLSAEPQATFADGVVEEITGALSRVHEFRVIARQSAFALRGEGLDVIAASERLRADYLVEGSVRRAGDRVRIAVQLVDGRSGATIWSDRYDDRMGDLFDLQDRIAAHVAGQLSPSLRQAEILRARTRPPEDRSAYDLTLTALPHFWAHRKDNNARALALLNAALERDPDYGPALAYKAWALAQQPSYMWSENPDADHRAAMEAADRASGMAGDHAPSLVAIAAAVTLSSNDVDRANSLIDRALAIDPNNAWGWMRRGWTYTYCGRCEDSLEAFDRAEELSPLDPFRFNIYFGQAVAVRVLGRYDESLRLIREGMHVNPGCTWIYRVLAGIYTLMGRKEDADAALRQLMQHYPHLTVRYLMDSIPPTARDFQPDYVAALQRMGVPE